VIGHVDLEIALAFLLVSIGFGTLLSASSLLLDETSYHTYPRPRQIVALVAAAIIENLGYRQLTAYWRLIGLVQWLVGTRQTWGEMKRTGAWTSELPAPPSPTMAARR
jgi:hypothetical protein